MTGAILPRTSAPLSTLSFLSFRWAGCTLEDLHTAYWPAWEGGFRREGTFVEFSKALIDDMHAWYHSSSGPEHEAGSGPKHDIGGIHFFDSIVAFEKRASAQPFAVTVGTPPH